MSNDSDDVVIRCRRNGPLIVTGPVRITDHVSSTFELPDRENIALCRCGASQRRPFCDGAHRSIGFQAEERADDG